jgi:hypothetical protein
VLPFGFSVMYRAQESWAVTGGRPRASVHTGLSLLSLGGFLSSLSSRRFLHLLVVFPAVPLYWLYQIRHPISHHTSSTYQPKGRRRRIRWNHAAALINPFFTLCSASSVGHVYLPGRLEKCEATHAHRFTPDGARRNVNVVS